MKTYRQSPTIFTILIALDIFLLFFTFGLWGIIMLKHILDYRNNYIIIGEDSVVLKTGTINVKQHEIRYSKINSIIINKTLFLFNSITIFSGNDVSGLHMNLVDKPEEIKAEIDKKTGN